MAPPKAAAAEAPPEPAPPKKGGSRLVIVLVIGVVALGGLGAAGWFLVPRLLGGKQAAAHAEERPEVKATIGLGAIVVNVSGGRQYLRAAVSLGVPKETDVKAVEEHRPELLDLLIDVLAAADVDTLTSEDGRDELKTQILERIHDDLRLTKVVRVYFTEYVIQ